MITIKQKDLAVSEAQLKEALNKKDGELFQAMMKDRLHKHIAEAIKNELSNATINFKVNKNEVSKGSLGGEPHKKRPSDEKNNS